MNEKRVQNHGLKAESFWNGDFEIMCEYLVVEAEQQLATSKHSILFTTELRFFFFFWCSTVPSNQPANRTAHFIHLHVASGLFMILSRLLVCSFAMKPSVVFSQPRLRVCSPHQSVLLILILAVIGWINGFRRAYSECTRSTNLRLRSKRILLSCFLHSLYYIRLCVSFCKSGWICSVEERANVHSRTNDEEYAVHVSLFTFFHLFICIHVFSSVTLLSAKLPTCSLNKFLRSFLI